MIGSVITINHDVINVGSQLEAVVDDILSKNFAKFVINFDYVHAYYLRLCR